MLYDKRWGNEVPPKPKKEEVPLQEWQRILLKAAAILRRDGWCRSKFQDAEGRLCAYGAINVAAGLEARKKKFQPVPVIEAIQHLERSLGGQTIIGWNDHYATGQKEVIATLRKAAKDTSTDRVYAIFP